jgi:anti-anti-sigma factor
MELNAVKKQGQLVVTFEGVQKLYILNHEEIKKELTWYKTIYHKELILDLSGIRFIDTTGFRLLMELNENYKNSGMKLLLSNVSKDAEELFELVKLNNLFERYKPKEELACVAA